jgi:diketogulonate reductase-like aldo/keto reductase
MIELPSGEQIPVLGIGSWRWAEDPRRAPDEQAALRLAVELGMTVVDTAEMYGNGAAESLIGEALTGLRDEVFLVSKVLPHNASRKGTIQACERSLRRLRTDRLDMYLLHWPGPHPLRDTVAAFEELKAAGKIRHWGVSNFDADDLAEVPDGVEMDQVLYNLMRRGIEYDLLRDRRVPIMAYSPLEQGVLARHPVLVEMGARHGATAAQVALAWVLSRDVVAIPKASTPERVRENHGALQVRLTPADFAELDRAFPPPRRKVPLEVL